MKYNSKIFGWLLKKQVYNLLYNLHNIYDKAHNVMGDP